MEKVAIRTPRLLTRGNWLTAWLMFAAMMCEYGSEYRTCGPACEQTCETISDDRPAECDQGCFEGCFCPYGMVRDERKQVLNPSCFNNTHTQESEQ